MDNSPAEFDFSVVEALMDNSMHFANMAMTSVKTHVSSGRAQDQMKEEPEPTIMAETYNQISNWFHGNGQSICLAVGLGGMTVSFLPGLVSVPLLWIAGFGSGGVAGGSLAANIHSGIGVVAAGSKFAIMQSAGAGGGGLAIVNGAIQGGAWAATGAAALVSGVKEALSLGEDPQPLPWNCKVLPCLEDCNRPKNWFEELKAMF